LGQRSTTFSSESDTTQLSGSSPEQDTPLTDSLSDGEFESSIELDQSRAVFQYSIGRTPEDYNVQGTLWSAREDEFHPGQRTTPRAHSQDRHPIAHRSLEGLRIYYESAVTDPKRLRSSEPPMRLNVPSDIQTPSEASTIGPVKDTVGPKPQDRQILMDRVNPMDLGSEASSDGGEVSEFHLDQTEALESARQQAIPSVPATVSDPSRTVDIATTSTLTERDQSLLLVGTQFDTADIIKDKGSKKHRPVNHEASSAECTNTLEDFDVDACQTHEAAVLSSAHGLQEIKVEVPDTNKSPSPGINEVVANLEILNLTPDSDLDEGCDTDSPGPSFVLSSSILGTTIELDKAKPRGYSSTSAHGVRSHAGCGQGSRPGTFRLNNNRQPSGGSSGGFSLGPGGFNGFQNGNGDPSGDGGGNATTVPGSTSANVEPRLDCLFRKHNPGHNNCVSSNFGGFVDAARLK
jgi:hypothetical protein